MLLFEDIISGDELFSDAFPVYDLSSFTEFWTHISLQQRSGRRSLRGGLPDDYS